MPELPGEKSERFIREYELTPYNAGIITREKSTADYFEECVKINQKLINKKEKPTDSRTIANWIINKKISTDNILPAHLIKQIIVSSYVTGITDGELEKILLKIIQDNPKPVEDYKKGKENSIMFLVGQSMRELKGKAKAEAIREKLIVLINSIKP